MTRFTLATIALAASALGGCATAPDPAALAAAQEPLYCKPGPDCTAKMEAAQVWIAGNAGMKLQTVTPVVIETYGPGDSTRLAVQVTRKPDTNGRHRIWVAIWCGNPFGCSRDRTEAMADFKRAVSAATAEGGN